MTPSHLNQLAIDIATRKQSIQDDENKISLIKENIKISKEILRALEKGYEKLKAKVGGEKKELGSASNGQSEP